MSDQFEIQGETCYVAPSATRLAPFDNAPLQVAFPSNGSTALNPWLYLTYQTLQASKVWM